MDRLLYVLGLLMSIEFQSSSIINQPIINQSLNNQFVTSTQNYLGVHKRHHSHEMNKYQRHHRQVTPSHRTDHHNTVSLSSHISQSYFSISKDPPSFQCGCKQINPTFQCKGDDIEQTMTIVMFLPFDPYFAFSLEKVLPALEIAVEIETRGDHLAGWNINLIPTDSNCSSITAPMKAFELYMSHTMYLFLGPVCDYSLSPVAIYSSQWNIPIISPGGFAYKFGQERTLAYKSLTRIGVTSESLSYVVQAHMAEYKWKKMKIIIDPDDHLTNFQRFCYLALSAVLQSFQENQINIKLDIHSLLNNTEYRRLLISEVGSDYADCCFLFLSSLGGTLVVLKVQPS